jgi:hypothetical protein
MITGPANFPVDRMKKARTSEDNKYRDFRNWRIRAVTAIAKKNRIAVDPLEAAKQKLESLKANHELMMSGNKVIRKFVAEKITKDECIDSLVSLGLERTEVEKLLDPKRFGGMGYASFSLTNNNAEIRRMEARVVELEARKQVVTNEKKFGSVRVVENAEADRLQVFFDGKPSGEIITIMKRNGFKWSPSNGCWQRQLTDNARYSLNHIISKIS